MKVFHTYQEDTKNFYFGIEAHFGYCFLWFFFIEAAPGIRPLTFHRFDAHPPPPSPKKLI